MAGPCRAKAATLANACAAASARARLISPDGAAVAVCVVPTDEELAIAEDIKLLLEERRRTGPPDPGEDRDGEGFA